MSELLLLSGGIDSVAIAAWRRPSLCVTIDYGQRPAEGEIRASSAVATVLQLHHEIIRLQGVPGAVGDLAGEKASILSKNSEWWPFRNQFLLTVAAMLAATRGLTTVLIGTVVTDQRHADGTPEFIDAIDNVCRHQEGQIRILAPAANLTTANLLLVSGLTKDVLGWTHSCHTSQHACGQCRGCQKHGEVMSALGINR